MLPAQQSPRLKRGQNEPILQRRMALRGNWLRDRWNADADQPFMRLSPQQRMYE